MILKQGKIYIDGFLREGSILINNGSIAEISFNPKEKAYNILYEQNKDEMEIDCRNKIILPGIIDIHSHLRDMEQMYKETFVTGTMSAAYSGITTVFNMPNTIPPAITEKQVKFWMEKAQNNIHVDVGFIAGVPEEIDEDEVNKIIKLGIIGFKIYPINPLSGVDWTNPENIQKILTISSTYQIPIFIHPAFPLSDIKKDEIISDFKIQKGPVLDLFNRLNPVKMEEKYISFVIDNYKKHISINRLNPKKFPIIHFCHVSCIEGYLKIKQVKPNIRISFEVTPHHLFLSHDIVLGNENFGKVLPPLRNPKHSQFLFNELREGNIALIGTDHAPHTLEEKSKDYLSAPYGFAGFETYPLVLLNSFTKYNLSLENFVKASSENPASIFYLKNKGFIKKGYDADLMIIEKIPEYRINTKNFKTKAKYSPFANYKTSIQIWKVFLRGIEINSDKTIPNGHIINRNL